MWVSVCVCVCVCTQVRASLSGVSLAHESHDMPESCITGQGSPLSVQPGAPLCASVCIVSHVFVWARGCNAALSLPSCSPRR